MHFRRIHALLLVLLAGSLSPTNAQSRVYRDRVTPHWDSTGGQFWYRNDLAGDAREFILVSATAGTRQPAFDHVRVADAFAKLLERNIDPRRIPVQELQFPPADSVLWTLQGPDGEFTWNPMDSTLQRVRPATAAALQLFLPPRPSGPSAEDTAIVFTNEWNAAVTLVWIDSGGGRRDYAVVAPGQTHRQHTFVGHAWLLRAADGQELGCVLAREGVNEWTLNADVVGTVRRAAEATRNRRAGRSNGSPPGNRPSPDNRFTAFVRDQNLWLRSTEPREWQLTGYASPEHTFRRDAQRARAMGMDYERENFPEDLADVHWSPNSSHLLAFQTTQVAERRVHYIESTPGDQLQPRLQSYPYLKPGDPIPVSTPRLFRAADQTEIPIANALFPNPWSLEFQRWRPDGSGFWLLYNERGHQRLRLLDISVEDGSVQAVIDEFNPTFIHYSSEGKFELRWLDDRTVLWASERSGWNHIYRYSLETRSLLNAVTQGTWNVRRIEHIDQSSGWVWFYAVGVVPGEDPYHEHFCRVRLDGTGFQLLTEGDGMHSVEWSPDRRWLLDRWSRVDQPPVTALRSADGEAICDLETADATELLAEYGRFPERFTAPGRDGSTSICGVIHRPRNFDPLKKYPVIENIYAGPHDYHVPKVFRTGRGHQQQLADRGFIVVQIDGMGTAWRSKAFHDVCWQNLKDAGFPDRIAWLRQAAATHPEMDLSRVGIYGGSAGGQNAMAALLWHGDFYRAAVADCGCHDNRMDKIWWNEQWMGVPAGDVYERNSNREHAHRLQGQLMLVVGELDRNVDPASTMQVAKKLVEAGRDFELLVVPGAGHGACETPWASRRRIEFFVRHLQPGSENR
ncbi:MAG: prolyl oligopeptidase family serine peptidase [Planctomycetota bacterium]